MSVLQFSINLGFCDFLETIKNCQYEHFFFMISPHKLLTLSKRASRINLKSRASPSYMSRNTNFFSMEADDSQRVYISYEEEPIQVVEEFFKYSRPQERNEQHSVVRDISQVVPPQPTPRRKVIDLSNTKMNLSLMRRLFADNS